MRDYKQTVRELRDPHFVYHFSRDYLKNMMDDAADAIEELYELVDSNKTAVKHGRWIPCRERLPEGAKRTYWVCTDEGDQMECRWTNANLIFSNLTTDWHWNIFDIPQYQKVIAWMPLPEPYKEGEAHETD